MEELKENYPRARMYMCLKNVEQCDNKYFLNIIEIILTAIRMTVSAWNDRSMSNILFVLYCKEIKKLICLFIGEIND